MPGKRVVLKLNQQQLELIDKTVARGEAADRAALVRRALTEFAARHQPKPAGAPRSKK
jgi:Arc/MetJ-type ribon-helix-helix transcriptional regulator